MTKKRDGGKTTQTKSIKWAMIVSLVLFVFASLCVLQTVQKTQRPEALATQPSTVQSVDTQDLSVSLGDIDNELPKDDLQRDGTGYKMTPNYKFTVPGNQDFNVHFELWFSWQSSFLGSSKIVDGKFGQRWIFGDGIPANQTTEAAIEENPSIGRYAYTQYFYIEGHKISFYNVMYANFGGNTDERSVWCSIAMDDYYTLGVWESRWAVPHNGQPQEMERFNRKPSTGWNDNKI